MGQASRLSYLVSHLSLCPCLRISASFFFALDKGFPSRVNLTDISGLSGNNSVVECNLAKVEVAGSNPVSRSIFFINVRCSEHGDGLSCGHGSRARYFLTNAPCPEGTLEHEKYSGAGVTVTKPLPTGRQAFRLEPAAQALALRVERLRQLLEAETVIE